MELPVLSDRNQYPTDEIVFSHIGKTNILWNLIFEYIHEKHPDISHGWNYYIDGKSWLLKAVRKSKTIFWLRIVEGSFKMAFYLNEKAEELINKSKISTELKKQYNSGKGKGKIWAVVIDFKNKKDVEYAKSLIEIKLSIK